MSKDYKFPCQKTIMRKVAFQNKEARKIIEKLIENLYVSYNMTEDEIYSIINDVLHANVLNEEMLKKKTKVETTVE